MTRRTSSIRRAVETLEPRRLMHGEFDVTFNFQPAGSPAAANTVADFGDVYGDRPDGYTFGWNVDSRDIMRDREKSADQRLDTVAQMQQGGINRSWELQIPNGAYEVTITSGDAKYLDGQHKIDAEGERVMYGVQKESKRFLTATKIITVSDGRLTLSAEPGGVNTKINSVRVASHHDGVEPDLEIVGVVATDDTLYERGDDTTAVLKFTRSGDDLSDELTANLDWSGSASTNDFRGRPNAVTFNSGSNIAYLTLSGRADDAVEPSEFAKVRLLASAAYAIGSPATAVVTLMNSPIPDPGPATLPILTVSTPDSSAAEAGGDGEIDITRDLTANALTVALNWTGDASTGDYQIGRSTPGGVVYANRPIEVTFDAGVSVLALRVRAVDDASVESTEAVTLSVVATADYGIAPGRGVGTVNIADNDVAPPSSSFTNINWSSATSPPIVYSESTSEVVNNKMYLFCGFNGVFSPQKNVYRFDGSSWSTMNNAPIAFTHVGSAVVDDKIWFAGGYISNGNGGQIFGTTVVRIYDTTHDSWSTGPSLPAGRAAGKLVKIGRRLYYFGGENQNRQADVTTNYSLDLDNLSAGWTVKAPMPMARNHITAVVYNNKVYVLGGQTGFDNNLSTHDDIQIFDPALNSWTVSSKRLPSARSHTAQSTLVYGNRFILIGGESAHNQPQNNVWSIDPSTLVTTALRSFPDARFSTACGIVNGKLYAIGGYKGSIATQAYVGTFV